MSRLFRRLRIVRAIRRLDRCRIADAWTLSGLVIDGQAHAALVAGTMWAPIWTSKVVLALRAQTGPA